MEKETIRLLRAEEIECRVAAINGKGLSLLLFKDARVDQRILDETFTPFGWRRSHQEINGNLYCTVEVWDREKGQWIAKQDVGTAGYAEKEKGQASDSFKRACFNWGVGRELYTAPFIWIPAGKAEILEREGRYVTPDRFRVRSIAYNSQREIRALSIVNGKGQTVFELKEKPEIPTEEAGRKNASESGEEAKSGRNSGREGSVKEQKTVGSDKRRKTAGSEEYDSKKKNAGSAEETGAAADPKTATEVEPPKPAKPAGKGKVSAAQKKALEKELERTGVTLETVLERYHISGIGQMTPEIYTNALNSLKKTKPKEAA